jgi:hypothetical protein
MPAKMPEGMSVAYENSASHSYMVVKAADGRQILDYQVSMLEHDRPDYLLPVKIKRENGTTHFYFDITSRLTLEFLLKRKRLKRNEFVRLLADAARPLADCEGYLLKDSGFLLDAGFIYIDPETFRLYLAYLPIRAGEDMSEVFKGFVADLILHHAVIEEAGSDNFLQRILGFVKRDNFNVGEFLGLLEELMCRPQICREATDTPADKREAVKREEEAGSPKTIKMDSKRLRLPAAVISQALIAAAVLSCRKLLEEIPGNIKVTYGAVVLIALAADILIFKNLFYRKGPVILPGARDKKSEKTAAPEPGGSSAASGAAPAFAGARPPVQGKTELLESMKSAFPILRSRNSPEFEEIVIDKPEFVIGRLPDQTDHVCRNNAIGKVHALIRIKGDSLYINDLNSVNGTYVNGGRIESNKDVEVYDGDCIVLANSEYVLINK